MGAGEAAHAASVPTLKHPERRPQNRERYSSGTQRAAMAWIDGKVQDSPGARSAVAQGSESVGAGDPWVRGAPLTDSHDRAAGEER